MSQHQPSSQAAGSKPWLSRIARVVGEMFFVIAIFAVTGMITSLLVPMPFDVVRGRHYDGEEAEALARTFNRRYWVGWLVLIPCAAAFWGLRLGASRVLHK